MPIGIVPIEDQIVNNKKVICKNNTNPEEISLNDLLENIRIIFNYIKKKRKNQK